MEQKQAKVELKSPELVYIWADEYMAEEVIRNYIGNALNHIEGEKRIWISVKKENSKAHLEVRNTGTPIPEEDLGRIWDKFYKVDKARTREYGGSGIGLSIVKKIIEDHGGRIWATSREGTGTIMHFVLRKYQEVPANE